MWNLGAGTSATNPRSPTLREGDARFRNEAGARIEASRLHVVVLGLELEYANAHSAQAFLHETESSGTESAPAGALDEVEFGEGGLSAAEFDVEAERDHEVPHEVALVSDQPCLAKGGSLEQLHDGAPHAAGFEADAIEGVISSDGIEQSLDMFGLGAHEFRECHGECGSLQQRLRPAWQTVSHRHDFSASERLSLAYFAGGLDTDMIRGFDMPKTSPDAVASAIVDGAVKGDEDIYPDPMSRDLAAKYQAEPKSLERLFGSM